MCIRDRIGQQGLGIALTDMNNFRRYNEQGYLHGDHVLKSFALQLKNATAPHAFCARYRLGDEFVLLFKAKDFEVVSGALKHIATGTSESDQLSFSYGIRVFTDPAYTVEEMLSDVHVLLLLNKKEAIAK
jgi:diguanylate cyclase (GGDEF)-like protein